ncbi:MAG TPA: NEW3 domain-containing protein, partial [Myxococcota bacterium]|nr:NEW3 domain-containing protein [Myxococcota bacterium]
AAAVPGLLVVRDAIAALPAASQAGLVAFYREQKLREIDRLLVELTGLYLDARSPSPLVVPGEAAKVSFTAWARSGDVVLTSLRWPDGRVEAVSSKGGVQQLSNPLKLEAEWTAKQDQALSTPFWLREAKNGHLFSTPGYLGVWPEGPPDVAVTATLAFKRGGKKPVDHLIEVVVPVRQSWVDPVHGERFRPVEVLPQVTVTPRSATLVLPNGKAQRLVVQVTAHGGRRAGRVEVVAPEGWTVSGDGAFELEAGAEAELSFEVTPPRAPKSKSTAATRDVLKVVARVGGLELGLARRVIDHTHIPTMTVLSEARVNAVVFPFEPGLQRIGYVLGPGDEVMRHLAAVGYEVTPLTVAELARADLDRFQAIVVGVRAFNQEPALVHQHQRLMDFVAKGGTYLVQYQVSSRFRPLGKIPIGPAPFSIAQGRVTDEQAAVTALESRVMSAPNRLENQDFEGWVQERGLYFAETWDPKYTPLLSMADPGEDAQQGAVLAMRHGKGTFIYTGLAFFRQLPEGVPGAYRLFANLLAWGKR